MSSDLFIIYFYVKRVDISLTHKNWMKMPSAAESWGQMSRFKARTHVVRFPAEGPDPPAGLAARPAPSSARRCPHLAGLTVTALRFRAVDHLGRPQTPTLVTKAAFLEVTCPSPPSPAWCPEEGSPL